MLGRDEAATDGHRLARSSNVRSATTCCDWQQCSSVTLTYHKSSAACHPLIRPEATWKV